MSPEQVQSILNDFAIRATRVGTRVDGAELWRFAVDDKHYELHYWEDDNTAIRKYLGGANAGREFTQLQTFQKRAIPATRVIANLKGFRIGDRKGDACIVVREPTTIPLNELFASKSIERVQRLQITASLIALFESLHRERLCPIPLSIDRFALRGQQVMIHNGAGTLGGIVDSERLRELEQSARFITTASERLRIWKHFTDRTPPRRSRAEAGSLTRNALRGEGTFAPIAIDDWVGRYVRKLPMALPWSKLNGALLDDAAWRDALPNLLADESATIKNDRSGSVRGSNLIIAGQSVPIIIKRPRFKPGFRGFTQQLRTSRAMRTWHKTWRMLGLGFRCEIPLLVLEKKSGPRVTEQLIIFERVPGETFDKIDLNKLDPASRHDVLYACGRTMREIESLRFMHADAKNANWIAWTDAEQRPHPILLDLDGIRFYPWRGMGYQRFLRAMKLHPQIRDDDLKAIATGYRYS